jgi:hypothetical protein
MRLKPVLSISNDVNEKYKLFAPDETVIERLTDSYSKHCSGIVQVEVGHTEVVSLGDVTAVKGIWLSASKDCQIKLNGGSNIQLRKAPVSTGDDKAGLFLEADITSIEVTGGTEAVTIIYAVWGDAI